MPDDLQKRSGPAWPIAITVICLALIGLGGFVFKSCFRNPADLVQSVTEAARPQVTINTVIQTSLERLREESKLVVFTADVAVMVTKNSEKKVLFGKLDLGTTTVRIRAAGNKAQLVIPLKELSESDFQYDPDLDLLTITVPPPRVDETLVEVQTDPTYYEVETELGWARIDDFSGDFLRDQARRELRPAVIAEASDPRIIRLAKQSGKDQLQALLEAAVKPIRPDTEIRIEYRDDRNITGGKADRPD